MRYRAFVLTVLLGIMALPTFGASNFLGGMSGSLYTPDDVITPRGTWELSHHWTFNAFSNNDDIRSTGIQYGLIRNLEVGVSFISNGDTDLAINGKYMIVPETATVPNVSVGVFDATGEVGAVNGDPSLYIMLSKNITPFASKVAGSPSKPLRLSIGAGSGVYKSFFAGFDWTFTPRMSLMFDYTAGRINDEEHIASAGLRYALTDTVRVDAAFFNFSDFGIGASVRSAFK